MARRRVLRTAAGSAATLLWPVGNAWSATWPEKPVRLINGFAAGGASDILTRLPAERLQQRLRQPFSVENRTGAGGNLSINPFLYAKLAFDPAKDFAYVSTFWENTNVFVVPAARERLKWREAVRLSGAKSE